MTRQELINKLEAEVIRLSKERDGTKTITRERELYQYQSGILYALDQIKYKLNQL